MAVILARNNDAPRAGPEEPVFLGWGYNRTGTWWTAGQVPRTKRPRMKTTLDSGAFINAAQELTKANAAFRWSYPGDSGRRQPVHTFYGGAHLFRADASERLGALAQRALAEYAPDAAAFAAALELPAGPAADEVYVRVTEKLSREPIEDFRIDFEDGYGNRTDAEEDHHAVAAAA